MPSLLGIAHPNARISGATVLPKSTLPQVLARQTQYLASMAKTIKDQRDEQLKDLNALTEVSTKGMRFDDLNKINGRLKEFDQYAMETMRAYKKGELDADAARIKIAGKKHELETVINKSIGDAVDADKAVSWVGQNADKIDVPNAMQIISEYSKGDIMGRGTFPLERVYSSIKEPFDYQKFMTGYKATQAQSQFDNPDYGTNRTVANLKDIETQVRNSVGTREWNNFMKWGLAPEGNAPPKFTNEEEAIQFAIAEKASEVDKAYGYTKKDNRDSSAVIQLPSANLTPSAVTYSPGWTTNKQSYQSQDRVSLFPQPLNNITSLQNIEIGNAGEGTELAKAMGVSTRYAATENAFSKSAKTQTSGKINPINATFESIQYMPQAITDRVMDDGTVIKAGNFIPPKYYNEEAWTGHVKIVPMVQIRIVDANKNASTTDRQWSTVSEPYEGALQSWMEAQPKWGKKGTEKVNATKDILSKKVKAEYPKTYKVSKSKQAGL